MTVNQPDAPQLFVGIRLRGLVRHDHLSFQDALDLRPVLPLDADMVSRDDEESLGTKVERKRFALFMDLPQRNERFLLFDLFLQSVEPRLQILQFR